MLLSFKDLLEDNEDRTIIQAEVTTEHPESHYGQPVIVLPDGGALGLFSWVSMDYRVVEATPEELRAVLDMGIGVDLSGLLYNVDSRFGAEALIATRDRWEELMRPRLVEWYAEIEEGLYGGSLEDFIEDALDNGLREVQP